MSRSATMKAMVLTGHGDLDRYEWRTDWPRPEPAPGEVLIRVGACGLNNTDVNTRTGWYSRAVREATTGGAHAALLGRRVMVNGWLRDWDDPDNKDKTGYFGSECDGGFAEYCVADARGVVPVDSPLSDAELATFACSYSTAEGMLERAQVGPDDTVLVPGASGGVGGALVQLARLDPDRILPRAPADLRAALGADRVTVMADVVGGPYWPQLIEVLERGGRYTCAGAIAGPIVPFDLRTFYLRDLTFTGSTVLSPRVLETIVRHIEEGRLHPVLAATYPLSELRAAQQAFIDKTHTGNIVVIP